MTNAERKAQCVSVPTSVWKSYGRPKQQRIMANCLHWNIKPIGKKGNMWKSQILVTCKNFDRCQVGRT